MPTYTFVCGKCGGSRDVVASMSEAGACAPDCCGGPMVREFRVPQVKGDAYRAARVVSQLQSLDGDAMKDPPPFESRSEEKRYIAEHNRVFGTKFEY